MCPLQSAADGSGGLVLQQAGEKLLDVLALEDGGRSLYGTEATEFFRIRRPQGAVFTMDSVSALNCPPGRQHKAFVSTLA